MQDNTPHVPLPRPMAPPSSPSTSSSIPSMTATTGSSPTRRLSLTIPSPIRRTQPLPVPARHGSISFPAGSARQRQSFSQGQGHRQSFGSYSEGRDARGHGYGYEALFAGGGEMEDEKLDGGDWLDGVVGDIELDEGEGEGKEVIVVGDTSMEIAVETLLGSGKSSLLVDLGEGRHAFFDFSDLNVFLLLVLRAASCVPDPSSEKTDPTETENEAGQSGHVTRLLRAGHKVPVSAVCNVSEKNPCHSIESDCTIRDLLPLLASGVHRVLVSSSLRILSTPSVLRHLVTLSPTPTFFQRTFISPDLDLPLHPLISLSGTSSVLDAMQIMSVHGLSALGVLSTSPSSSFSRTQHHRAGSSSSGSSASTNPLSRTRTSSLNHGHGYARRTGSFNQHSKSSSQVFATSPGPSSPGFELPSPFDTSSTMAMGQIAELAGVITVEDCARLVVPSEGKQALGMGLEQAIKSMHLAEHAGQERGEERVLVHTITQQTSILRASHLILAVSSSRVFLPTTPQGQGIVGMSPSPSLSFSTSISTLSPSISALSLSDPPPQGQSTSPVPVHGSGLPEPPATKLSPHSVVSITDILGSVVRAYLGDEAQTHTGTQRGTDWILEPRKRRDSMDLAKDTTKVSEDGMGLHSESNPGGLGLGGWRWAKGVSGDAATES